MWNTHGILFRYKFIYKKGHAILKQGLPSGKIILPQPNQSGRREIINSDLLLSSTRKKKNIQLQSPLAILFHPSKKRKGKEKKNKTKQNNKTGKQWWRDTGLSGDWEQISRQQNASIPPNFHTVFFHSKCHIHISAKVMWHNKRQQTQLKEILLSIRNTSKIYPECSKTILKALDHEYKVTMINMQKYLKEKSRKHARINNLNREVKIVTKNFLNIINKSSITKMKNVLYGLISRWTWLR